MGIGPAPVTQKPLVRLGMKIGQFDVIELNEAFALQGLAAYLCSALRTMTSG